MRQDVDKFTALDTEIIVIAPDTMGNAQSFFKRSPVPFTALVDDALDVYQQFDVQSRLISLGQRPGLFVIDKSGVVRFAFIGAQQWEIPPNQKVLDVLREIEQNPASQTQRNPK